LRSHVVVRHPNRPDHTSSQGRGVLDAFEPLHELFVSGSAVVRQDRDEAVARAVLDATNRRLGRTAPAR